MLGLLSKRQQTGVPRIIVAKSVKITSCENQDPLLRLAPLLSSFGLTLSLDTGLVLRFTLGRGDPGHDIGERVLNDSDPGDFGGTGWVCPSI